MDENTLTLFEMQKKSEHNASTLSLKVYLIFTLPENNRGAVLK